MTDKSISLTPVTSGAFAHCNSGAHMHQYSAPISHGVVGGTTNAMQNTARVMMGVERMQRLRAAVDEIFDGSQCESIKKQLMPFVYFDDAKRD